MFFETWKLVFKRTGAKREKTRHFDTEGSALAYTRRKKAQSNAYLFLRIEGPGGTLVDPN